MAKEDKYWNNPVDLNVDWGGDPEKTEGKPLSGRAVQDTIKNAFDSKVGYVGYCETTKKNVLTKDKESFDIYNTVDDYRALFGIYTRVLAILMVFMNSLASLALISKFSPKPNPDIP